MHISDWSSDVCSSDLQRGSSPLSSGATGRQFRPSWCFLRETFARLRKPPIAGEKCGKHVGHKFGQWFRLPIGVIVDNNIVRERAEIGRASCRERVGKYV